MLFNLLLIPKNYSIPLYIFKESLAVSFHHLSLLSIGRSLLIDVREEKSLQLTTNYFKISSTSKRMQIESCLHEFKANLRVRTKIGSNLNVSHKSNHTS